MNKAFSVVFVAFLLMYLTSGCIEHRQEAKRYYSEGRSLENKGNYEQASEKYCLAFKIYPAYTEAHIKYQDMQIAMGRYQEVYDKYRKLLNGRPKSPCYSYLCARLEKDVSKRMALYEKALKLEPNYRWAMYGIGNELLNQGKNQEAVKQFKKVIEIDSEFPPVHMSLAKAWFSMKLYDPALSEIKKYCQLMPDSQTGEEMAGNIYYAKKDLKKAEACWIKASSMSKSSTSSLLSLAKLYLELKNYPECGKAIGQIYSVNPSHVGAKICEAWLKLRCGNAADAASISSALLAKDPSNNEALKIKAAVFASRGDRKHERDILVKILKNHPYDFSVAEDLASAEYALGNNETAISIISNLEKVGKLSLKSSRIMRNILFYAGKHSDSLVYAKSACNQSDNNPDDLNALALIYALLDDSDGICDVFENKDIEHPDNLAQIIYFIIKKENRKKIAPVLLSLSKKSSDSYDSLRLNALSKAFSGDINGAIIALKDISGSEIFILMLKYESGNKKAVSELISLLKKIKSSKSSNESVFCDIVLMHALFDPKNKKLADQSIQKLEKINVDSNSMIVYAISFAELERQRALIKTEPVSKGSKKNE